jgi:hypothetical protein
MKWPASRGSSAVIGEPWDRKSGGRVSISSLEHRRAIGVQGLHGEFNARREAFVPGAAGPLAKSATV